MNMMKDLSAIIVQDKSSVLKSKFTTYSHAIWGKSIFEWVATALAGIAYEKIEIENKNELLLAVKKAAGDTKYTLVLFADTPLLKAGTIADIYSALVSGKTAIKLTSGYAFLTEQLLKTETLAGIAYQSFDEEDFIPATSYKQLSFISELLRQRILDYHMENGVYIIDPATTYIDSDVVIGSGATVHPGNHLQGKCKIESDVILKPNNMLKNAYIKSGAVLWASTVEDSEIGSKTTVGPYAYIRNGAVLGENCRVGDYVEIKKSTVGNGTKMAHLTYVGDAVIGEKCNLGCGVIFANYDGKNKFQTTVGNQVFIGSNCNLIAPLTVHDKAFIAAGTTVTEDVLEGKLAIGRVRQTQKDYKSNYLLDEK